MKDAKQLSEENAIINVNELCIESLSPEIMEAWDKVKFWLIKNRNLDTALLTEMP